MIGSADEPFTQYGLLAKHIEVPSDRSWVRFHLHPQAKFSDGKPVTAEDVVFSFDLLVEKGSPHYKSYYAGVEKVQVISKRVVEFIFKPGDNRELPLVVGQLTILPKHYWQAHDFSRSSLEVPLGSGPYKIKSFDAGRRITYERRKNYWGWDIAVNRGRHNFDSLIYDYYRDTTVAFQAFKAGEYDYNLESSSKRWATGYTGEVFDSGKIIKAKIPDANPQGMQGFWFNTRKGKFSNPKVRAAISQLFDFEWVNKKLFYSAYTRSHSYFNNSELASSGLPRGYELEVLRRFEDKLPPSVFNRVYRPPKTPGDGYIREQMRVAVKLMQAAGYQLKNGQMVNKLGFPFYIEFLTYDKDFERIIQPFRRNLRRIGINSEIRLVDTSQFINRLNSFDFDLVSLRQGQSNSPGNEQHEFWSCETAQRTGSRNWAGVCDPVVDELIQLIITAESRQSLVARTRALDRVLLWKYLVVPQWYLAANRLAYWDIFGQPKVRPIYGLGLDTWWAKSSE